MDAKELLDELLDSTERITRNRFSIINGKTDLSAYAMKLKKESGKCLDYIEKGEYSDIQKCIAMILLAEIEYQNNNCYKALVLCNSSLAFLENSDFVELWVVARFIQMSIMIVTGQLKAIYPMVNGMSDRVEASGNQELKDNYEALKVWCALYDGDRSKIDAWLEKKAPNEFDFIQEKDMSRYFIKARVYYMQEKYLVALSLLQNMEKMVASGGRDMEICELHMLKSIVLFALGDEDKAVNEYGIALDISEKCGFLRLLADEGNAVFGVSRRFIAENESRNKYAQNVMLAAREIAMTYPNYLTKRGDQVYRLTDREKEVINLMMVGRSNAEIAHFLSCSVNTVKYHLKNIYAKLGVNCREDALEVAKKEKLI